MGARPAVSICIPTWQGADVLGNAIDCALAQTVTDSEIIIAVDGSTDGTRQLAESRARTEPRIRVISQPHRVGWSRNVNAALAAVEGEHFFLYPHDDTITPDYVERLLAVLEANPDAGSACGAVRLRMPDGRESLTVGESFNERPVGRMRRFLIGDDRGAVLRALTRRRLLTNRLRLAEGSLSGFRAHLAYVFELIAAAPCIQLPDELYVRDAMRPSGLVKTWVDLGADIVVGDLSKVAAALLATIKAHAPNRAREHLATLVLIDVAERMHHTFKSRKLGAPPAINHLHPDFDENAVEARIASLPDGWTARASAKWRKAIRLAESAARS